MGRKMYVYTKKEFLNNFNENLLINYWYDITKAIDEGVGDIHTTNVKALHGAQANFDEIYVDGKQLWPSDKTDPYWGPKELRPAHDLSRLIGAWTSFKNNRDDILDSNTNILEI